MVLVRRMKRGKSEVFDVDFLLRNFAFLKKGKLYLRY